MFGPTPMVHFRIQVPNADATGVARAIAREGMLHLARVAHGRIGTDLAPPGTRESLAAFRAVQERLEAAAHRLGLAPIDLEGRLEVPDVLDLERLLAAVEASAGPILAEVDEAWTRVTEARRAETEASHHLDRARRLAGTGLAGERLAGLTFVTLRFGLAPAEVLLELSGIVAPTPVVVVPLATEEARTAALVAVPTSQADRLEAALRVVPFETIELPRDDPDAWDPVEGERRLAVAAADRLLAEDALATLKGLHGHALDELREAVEVAVLLLDAQTRFASAGAFTVISGWLPAESAGAIERVIERATEGRAVVEVETPEDMPGVASGAIRVPILHRNPLLLRPFQSLVRLYGTPEYREVEPTAFFGLTFLVMFGLMFGDIGHGLVLFSAGWCLFRWFPRFLDYGVLLMEAGAASAFFGLLYGSLFGIEGLLPVLWMEPLRDLGDFMVVAVGFGVAMITGGLLLGVVNAWRRGERSSALVGAHGLLGATLYWVLLLLLVRAFFPGDFAVPEWVLIAGAGLALLLILARPLVVRFLGAGRGAPPDIKSPRWLTLLEGSVELVEAVFSFFTGTVSFVRIAAFAAVHAGVFVAVFAIAETLADARLGGLWAGIALVAGNVLVILLEGLTVSVQVLRLEYFEFFSKFFRGGGEPYTPFSLKPGKGAPP